MVAALVTVVLGQQRVFNDADETNAQDSPADENSPRLRSYTVDLTVPCRRVFGDDHPRTRKAADNLAAAQLSLSGVGPSGRFRSRGRVIAGADHASSPGSRRPDGPSWRIHGGRTGPSFQRDYQRFESQVGVDQTEFRHPADRAMRQPPPIRLPSLLRSRATTRCSGGRATRGRRQLRRRAAPGEPRGRATPSRRDVTRAPACKIIHGRQTTEQLLGRRKGI